jgi:hypothetical protein
MEDQRLETGIRIAEAIWFSFAQRILEKAAILYNWTPAQKSEMEEQFLRPNDYIVEALYSS